MTNQSKPRAFQLEQVKHLVGIADVPLTLVKNSKLRHSIQDNPIPFSPLNSPLQQYATPRKLSSIIEKGDNEETVRYPKRVFLYT
jgi:hypothetical protein